jgi:hypothetical protein
MKILSNKKELVHGDECDSSFLEKLPGMLSCRSAEEGVDAAAAAAAAGDEQQQQQQQAAAAGFTANSQLAPLWTTLLAGSTTCTY